MADNKPSKPYPDFPLFPHATGRWAKKIRGKFCYFGPWSDPTAALKKYLAERDDLQAGLTPRPTSGDAFTIRELCNRFLSSKKLMVENQELGERMWTDYFGICERIIDVFGRTRLVSDLRAEDFEKLRTKFADGVGLQTLTNRVRMTRTVFKWCYEAELVEKPVRYGPNFKLPAKKLLRADRQSKPSRMFEATELRQVIATAKIPLKAMVLLGINCGYGNTDCAKLPQSTVDLGEGWITFPRPKTAVMRRCPLWPETITALREAIAARPKPRHENDAELVFVTKYGKAFVRMSENGTGVPLDAIGPQLSKLLTFLQIDRPGLNFYALRHTFETVAGATRDQVAVSAIMGHAPHANDMSAVYRERIDEERLKAVTDHVRAWLWPKPAKKSAKKTAKKATTR